MNPKSTLLICSLMTASLLVTMDIHYGMVKDKEPPTKSIRGHVADSNNRSVVGAKVFIKNLKKNTTRILVTDKNGLFSTYGLDPKVDYEVHAEDGNLVSETMTVSAYLNRLDNVFNFVLGKRSEKRRSSHRGGPEVQSIEIVTTDQVKLVGDWYQPGADEEKVPVVLLLHGFGEQRGVWEKYIEEYLLGKNIAALSVDLRGHGASTEKDRKQISADQNWVTDPNQFPADLQATIEWLKSQERIDQNRVAVIGTGLGADLAFIASGKYELVRTAVALSGNFENAQALAGEKTNFQPHSILYIATQGDPKAVASAEQFKPLTGFPVRVEVFKDSSAHGSKILEEIPEAVKLTVEWLENTL